MVSTGTVWRVEIVTSTLHYSDDVKKTINKLLMSIPEFDNFLVEELYEDLKTLQTLEETAEES